MSLYIPFLHSSLHFHPKRCKSTTPLNWQTLLSNQVSIPLPPFHAHYYCCFTPALVSCHFFNHFKLTFFVLHSFTIVSCPLLLLLCACFCCCFCAHFHCHFHACFHCHLMPFPLSFYTSFVILSHQPLFHLSSLCASNSYP